MHQESQLLERASLLLDQQRFSEAEKVLHQILTADPDQVSAICLNVLIQLERGELKVARQQLDRALALSPDWSYIHFLDAKYHVLSNKPDQAIKKIDEAIILEPEEADYYAFKALILLDQVKFEEALKTAQQALSLDATNVLAQNCQSRALAKLKRKPEAGASMDYALSENPENAFTHATVGYNYLESGDVEKAKHHFKTSLQFDPHSEYAKAGLMSAIKSTNFFYRQFFRYATWMSERSSSMQWIIILAVYFGYRVLNGLSDTYTWLTPLSVAVYALILSTWFIDPISNLLIQLHPMGKHLLTRKERISANLSGVFLLLSILGGVAYLFTSADPYLSVAIVGLGMVLPCSFLFEQTRFAYAVPVFAGVMLVVGLLFIAATFGLNSIGNIFLPAFVVLAVGFTWVINLLVVR